MKRHTRVCIVLGALVLLLGFAALLWQESNLSHPEEDHTNFRFGFVTEADIPKLIEDTLSPEHLIEEITDENGTVSAALYDGESLIPWLLNCSTVERVEHFGDSVYVSYRPVEPQSCDTIVLHCMDGKIVDIATSWEHGSYFISADLVTGQICGE